MTDDIYGNLFFVLNPEKYINEAISQYMILYIFGMVARYAPDIWIKSIDENRNFFELIDSLLNITQLSQEKFGIKPLKQEGNDEINRSMKDSNSFLESKKISVFFNADIRSLSNI